MPTLDDEDLAPYILVGLDEDYDSVVNYAHAHPQAITVNQFTSLMLAFESRVDLRSSGSGSSTNFARRGHDGFGRDMGCGRSDRNGPSPTKGRDDHGVWHGGRGSNNNSPERPQCQVYLKYGHTAERYW
jgi:hypothetical protein